MESSYKPTDNLSGVVFFNEDGIRWLMRIAIRFLSSKIQSSLNIVLNQNYILGDEFDSLLKDCIKYNIR